MPQGDGTGPNGQGPMTGRGMGYCAGFDSPGFVNSCFRRGFGRGRRFAFGARAMQAQQPVKLTENEEKKILEASLEDLKEEMKAIEKRLKEIKN